MTRPPAHLRPEPDYELLWALLLPVLAAMAALVFALGFVLPKCVLFSLTGVPCLGCGGTRALRFLVGGDWGGALLANPMVVVLVGLVFLFWLYCLGVVLRWLPRWRPSAVAPKWAWGLRAALVVLLSANWIYLIARYAG